MDYTTTALLSSVRRRAMLPSATATGTADADLLALANEELQFFLVPLLLDLREDYLLHRYTVAMTAGRAEYRLPSRAIGAKLREVEVVEASGAIRNLTRIGPDELEDQPTANGRPEAFYFRGNYVSLVPPPASSETLRLTYYIRPNELVASSAVATVQSVNTSTGVVTCTAAVPVTFATSVTYDLVAGTSGFEHLAISLTPSAVGASSVTFTAADLPTGLAAGDYVCLAEKSPVAQVPADLHPLLAQRVAMKVLEQLGDFQGMKAAGAVLDQMTEQLRTTFAPRADGEAKICAPDSHGLMGPWGGRERWW